jgi:cell division protein FtsQ
VKNVAIRRALPHTLRVEVDERVPVALISHAGKFYIIDEDLFVIAERKYADGANVPTITDLPIGKIKIGETIANDSLANAVKCLKSMDPSLKKTIVLISAPAVDKLSLYNKDNIEIFYGDAKQADDKNRVLETILKEQGRQVIFIDIRSYPHSDPVLRRIDSVP